MRIIGAIAIYLFFIVSIAWLLKTCGADDWTRGFWLGITHSTIIPLLIYYLLKSSK